MPQLQVALDTVSLSQALIIAAQLSNIDVRIEVGTPLIIRYGMAAVAAVRSCLPAHYLVADCKVMDRGDTIVAMCKAAGADSVIIQESAGEATFHRAARTAESVGIELMLDRMGQPSLPVDQAKLQSSRVSHIICHISKDVQRERGLCFEPGLRETWCNSNQATAIAGGITAAALRSSSELHAYSLIIVGEAIYSNPAPLRATQEVLRALREYRIDCDGTF